MSGSSAQGGGDGRGHRGGRSTRISELRRSRPRRLLLRISVLLLAALVVYSWLSGTFDLRDLASDRAQRNLARFLGEVRPYPLQGVGWNLSTYVIWLRETILPHAQVALGATLALSVAAICLSGLGAALFAPLAAHALATPSPYLSGGRSPGRGSRFAWTGLVWVCRLFFVFVRSIPEYLWAFLLLSVLGVGPWPAVLALAVHNLGILARLYAETIENSAVAPSAQLRSIGGSRTQIYLLSLFPGVLGRYLLYFFYRWETCVREATVLGLLGFVSLGWFIQDARAGVRYDEMFHFVLLGSVLIVLGDLVSGSVRRRIRKRV